LILFSTSDLINKDETMKNITLFEKPRHKEIDEKFHQLTIGNVGNVLYWERFFEMAKNVPGDIVECGVGGGRSFLIIAALNHLLEKNEGGQRTVYGYDSFEGFPEPTKEDESPRHPKRGEWSCSPSGTYIYSPEFTRTVLAEAGIPRDALPIIKKGFFEQVLPAHPKKPIALLHIDGDLYQSYKATLENLFNLVSPRGIIVFDDFLAEPIGPDPFPGARKAVQEFFGRKINKLRVSIAGKYYYVKR
jgi:hypothetical protein